MLDRSKQSAQRRGSNRDVDMTSMVDVTFLLLVFFMVTASFALQKAIATPVPESDSASHNFQDQQDVFIDVGADARGACFVRTPNWQQQVVGKQDLTSTLRRSITEQHESVTIRVFIEEEAMLQALVDALDSATTANPKSISIQQVETLDEMEVR